MYDFKNVMLTICGVVMKGYAPDVNSIHLTSKERTMEQVSGQQVVQELAAAGFQAGVAVATDAEVQAGAACGQVAFEEAQSEAPKVVVADLGVSL